MNWFSWKSPSVGSRVVPQTEMQMQRWRQKSNTYTHKHDCQCGCVRAVTRALTGGTLSAARQMLSANVHTQQQVRSPAVPCGKWSCCVQILWVRRKSLLYAFTICCCCPVPSFDLFLLFVNWIKLTTPAAWQSMQIPQARVPLEEKS